MRTLKQHIITAYLTISYQVQRLISSDSICINLQEGNPACSPSGVLLGPLVAKKRSQAAHIDTVTTPGNFLRRWSLGHMWIGCDAENDSDQKSFDAPSLGALSNIQCPCQALSILYEINSRCAEIWQCEFGEDENKFDFTPVFRGGTYSIWNFGNASSIFFSNLQDSKLVPPHGLKFQHPLVAWHDRQCNPQY